MLTANILTASAGPCKMVAWRMHPAGTDAPVQGQALDHWTGT